MEHPWPRCRRLDIHIQDPQRNPVPALARAKLVPPQHPHLQHLVLGILLKVVESEREFKEVLAEFAFGGRKKQELDQPWWPHPLAPLNPNSKEGTAALQRRTSQGTGNSAA